MVSRARLAARPRASVPAWRLAGLIVAWLLVAAGCAGGAPEPIATGATLRASDDVNPDNAGRASPVVVRIFRWSAGETFRTVGLVNLQGDEPALMARDLTGPVLSRLLRPGQAVALDLSYAPDTAYLGVVAEFIDPGAEWRTLVAVPVAGRLGALRRPDLTVTVSADAVAASFE